MGAAITSFRFMQQRHLLSESLARQCYQKTALIEPRPNDDMNLGQSSNDVFPSAMHITVVGQTKRSLLPALDELRSVLTANALAFRPLRSELGAVFQRRLPERHAHHCGRPDKTQSATRS